VDRYYERKRWSHGLRVVEGCEGLDRCQSEERKKPSHQLLQMLSSLRGTRDLGDKRWSERERDTHTETERERQRETETERETDRERETERQRETERSGEKENGGSSTHLTTVPKGLTVMLEVVVGDEGHGVMNILH
jgi:hypothetical protein